MELGHFVPVSNYASGNYNVWDRKGASPFIINLRGRSSCVARYCLEMKSCADSNCGQWDSLVTVLFHNVSLSPPHLSGVHMCGIGPAFI